MSCCYGGVLFLFYFRRNCVTFRVLFLFTNYRTVIWTITECLSPICILIQNELDQDIHHLAYQFSKIRLVNFWFGFPFGNPSPSPSFVSDGIILKFVAIVLMLKCAIILWMCCNDAVHVFRNYTAFALQFCNQCSIIIQHMCCKWDAIPMYCLCLKNLSILFFFIYLLSIILVPSEIQTLMSLTLLVWLWQNTKSPL